MELIAALALGSVLWLSALMGQTQPTTVLAEPLDPLLGPIFAGAVVACCVAAACLLAVGALGTTIEAVFGDMLPAAPAHRLMLIPLQRRGNQAFATVGVAAPVAILVRLLSAPSPVAGELIVLGMLCFLAGAQALHPRSYRHELLPGLVSFPQRLAALTLRDRIDGAALEAAASVRGDQPLARPDQTPGPFEPGAYEGVTDVAPVPTR